MSREGVPCSYCGEQPEMADGYCGHCRWLIWAELEEGFRQLGDYLAAHAAFSEWLTAHGVPA